MQSKKIELDEYGEEALELAANSNISFFLTGNGGTGKTFLINHFLNQNSTLPEKQQKKVQMLATTGAAAQLYEFGETYHSFFRIFGERLGQVNKEQKDIMKYFDTYIIDEASMISSSQFDLLNRRLQQVTGVHDKLFGGKQIIFVGHLFQASPVVSEQTKEEYEEIYHKKYDDIYKSIFFFDAISFDPKYFKIIELKKTHRTTDVKLQIYLKNLMLGENLNAVCSYFNKNYKKEHEIDYDKAIYIANTNLKVDKYNNLKLEQLEKQGQQIHISSATYFNWDTDNYGKIIKDPAPQELKYCIGSRVIFTRNADLFKNGTMGTIIDIGILHDYLNNKDLDFVDVLIDGNIKPIKLTKTTWNKFKSIIIGTDDEGQDIIEHQIIGNYVQFPFQLGWGITAHKSQGKTFDKIICDIGLVSYKEGNNWKKKPQQHILYVALSRSTNYEGIQIIQKLRPEFVEVNQDVKEIVNKLIK